VEIDSTQSITIVEQDDLLRPSVNEQPAEETIQVIEKIGPLLFVQMNQIGGIVRVKLMATDAQLVEI
jgi:uncharacterized protein YjfI (DUF2170 family)